MLCRLFRFLLVFGLTNASRWHQIQGNFATDCLVVLDRERFDLCPLAIAPQRILEYEFPPQSGDERTTYILRVGEEETDPRGRGSKCSPGMWICMNVDRSHDPPRQIPIKASFISGTHGATDLRRLPIYHPSKFEIGEAHIVFICDPQAHGQPPPDFIGESKGVLLFAWHTAHACHRTAPSPNYTVTEEDAAPGEEDQNDKPEDEQELIQRPISGSRLRSTATIILLTLSGIIILGYLIYSPPPLLRRFVSACMKPIQFRVGEVRLVQWAQEDMGFLEDEVDVMVNGIMDEQIPLKPTPRLSRSFANYGSAE